MKVSIVVGGRWHAFDLARELLGEGVLHRLITPYPKFKTRQWGIPDEKVVSLPIKLLLEKIIYKMGGELLSMQSQAFLHQLFALKAARHLEGSTLVHGWSGFSEPSLRWAKERGLPFILERSSAHMEVQCQLMRDEFGNLGLAWLETHKKLVEQELREYELADRVAVPSLFVKNSFLSRGFSENRLIHNPFGTNLKNFSPGAKPDRVFRIIYVGSLSVRKGIRYLVEGFKQASLPNSELWLVGGSTKETPLLLGEPDERIQCFGHVPQLELVNYYRNSSVFVMPSIEEGLAMVQVQALACGLPLICTTNTGGEDLLQMSGDRAVEIEDNVKEYPAGFTIPPRNSKAIAASLCSLAQDNILLKSKQHSALSLRRSHLDWKSYGKRAIEAYLALCQEGNSAIDM
ncbi:MAG: glycosyltransferase family 4 protein [SAR324 cluster bacterium]|nr:glycosyltransferase family 4 protein [SAR324 cluster bacterium]